MENMDAIQFEHVNFSIGENHILHDICAHVPKGMMTAVVGPNGAGKSTLILALLGQIKYSGDIKFFTRNPKFGFVPQRLDFDRCIPMTVADYLLSGIQKRPLFWGKSRKLLQVVMEYLKEVECESLADHSFGGLSGGEIQRVLLAQALLQKPEILILDEPTSGVDFKGGQVCCELLRKMRDKFGFTQIMISHDLATVTAHADHVICMNHSIYGEGVPMETLTHNVLSKTFGLHMGLPDIHGIPNDVLTCPANCPLGEQHAHLHEHCHCRHEHATSSERKGEE